MNFHFELPPPSTIEEARCQAANAEGLVEEQRRRIAVLKAKGSPSDQAEALLATFAETLRLFRDALARLEASRGVSPEPTFDESARGTELPPVVEYEIRLIVARALRKRAGLSYLDEATRIVRQHSASSASVPVVARQIRKLALANDVGLIEREPDARRLSAGRDDRRRRSCQ